MEDKCRLCLSSQIFRVSIFSKDLSHKNEVPLTDKIMDCVAVKISVEDHVSTLICYRCLFKVNEYYEFKEVCKKSDVHLKESVHNIQNRSSADITSVKEEFRNKSDPIHIFVKEEVIPETNNDAEELSQPELFENLGADDDGDIIRDDSSQQFFTSYDTAKDFDVTTALGDNADVGAEHDYEKHTLELVELSSQAQLEQNSSQPQIVSLCPISSSKTKKRMPDCVVSAIITKKPRILRQRMAPEKSPKKVNVIRKPELKEKVTPTIAMQVEVQTTKPPDSEVEEDNSRFRCKVCGSCWASPKLLMAHVTRAHSKNSKEKEQKLIIAGNGKHVKSKHYLIREFFPKSGAVRKAWCVVCMEHFLAKETLFRCGGCPNKPGLCVNPCFTKYHAKEQT